MIKICCLYIIHHVNSVAGMYEVIRVADELHLPWIKLREVQSYGFECHGSHFIHIKWENSCDCKSRDQLSLQVNGRRVAVKVVSSQ